MKVLIRKQRNEIYTVLYREDNTLHRDDSTDPRYWDDTHILSLAGPLGLSLLLGIDMEYLCGLPLGKTINVELTAIPIINATEHEEELWEKAEISASFQAAGLIAMGMGSQQWPS